MAHAPPGPTAPSTHLSERHRIHRCPEPAAPDRHEAERLFALYADRMRALIASRLRGPVACRISPDDVVQSVFRAFVERGLAWGHAAPDGQELWGLFCTLAMNKLRERIAYHQAARRDVRRTAGGVETLVEAGPADAAWLEVEVDDLLGRLRPADREVVRLRMAGYEVTEIADLTARSLRTVERVLQSARTKLTAQPA